MIVTQLFATESGPSILVAVATMVSRTCVRVNSADSSEADKHGFPKAEPVEWKPLDLPRKPMTTILLIYATTDGQTLKIMQRIQQLLTKPEQAVTLVAIDDAEGQPLSSFDKIVIGASIRYGRHNPKVKAFIQRQQALLDSKASAFFSVNVVARKPEKAQPASNPYLKRFLRQIVWRPKQLAVFAGKLDYPSLNGFDRRVIRLIMWITGGPTDPQAVIEFTDWQQVEAFARVIDAM